MGPRPFPLPLSIGTDICQISRIYSILAGSRGARFVSRVLAPEELAAARLVRPAVAALLARTPAPTGREREGSTGPSREGRDVELWGAATFVAGRFAAKEAVFKAHPWWRLGFHDIIIRTRGPAIVSDTKDGCPVYDNAGDSVASLLSDISSDAFSGRPVAIIKPPRLATGNGVASTARSEPSPDHDGEGQEALLSISHDGCYATAVCLAWDHGAGVGRR